MPPDRRVVLGRMPRDRRCPQLEEVLAEKAIKLGMLEKYRLARLPQCGPM